MSIQQIVPVSGARLWTVQQGTGPGLVLCHGGPGLRDYLSPVAAMLSDLCTVHRYDQRACGRSDGGGAHTVERNIADLEGLREHWGRNKRSDSDISLRC
jgi:proline iminopeptidase